MDSIPAASAREHDQFIMDVAIEHQLDDSQLKVINHCRMFRDLANATGTHLSADFQDGDYELLSHNNNHQ